MPLDCTLCNGEEEVFLFFANDSEQTIRLSLELCLCAGGHNTNSGHAKKGEKKITQSEYDRLKELWSKLPEGSKPLNE